MTAKDVQGPVTGLLADVRTQIAAIVVAMQGAGWLILSPAEQVRQLAEAQRAEIAAIRQEVNLQTRRTDSLVVGLRHVKLLVDAQCVQAEGRKDRMTLKALECDR